MAFMEHIIENIKPMLSKTVEIDETFVLYSEKGIKKEGKYLVKEVVFRLIAALVRSKVVFLQLVIVMDMNCLNVSTKVNHRQMMCLLFTVNQ